MFEYIANRDLKVSHPGGGTTISRKGDVIPDFEEWNPVAQKALLNQDCVRKQALEGVAEKSAAPTPDFAAYSCGQCTKEFKNEKGLKSHIGRAHK